ncbi:unnamed protein product [Spirodela intermedia]|uniref:SAM domain-containing protein n=1 Tax=Spirodela intermedia TaxID=51605 RepID=A0A7I8JCN4_SPIIN|nr:unnamed protein product [Spirodela intermedia]CAA6667900.1 unnamed protein product [Spirodela intermedia]
MYADQVATGRKLSVKDRLHGAVATDLGSGRQTAGVKRQRPEDLKWKHDLYMDTDGPQSSRPRFGDRDLRLKLQRKSSGQFQQGGRNPGVRDLREKLSGTMHSQPGNGDPSKAKAAAVVPEVARIAKQSVPSAEEPPWRPRSEHMQPEASIDGFLRSLGLEKYLITFQAEEVDMAALVHMTDDDLKALGIPMGPRKKIRLALDSRA